MSLTLAASLTIVANVLKIYKDAKDISPDIKKLYSGLIKVQPDDSSTLSEYLLKTHGYVSRISSFAYRGFRELRESIIVPKISSKERTKYTFSNAIQYESIPDKQLILIDSAGMGKSTALKFLTTTLIESGEYFPIFIEARKIKNAGNIKEFLAESVYSNSEKTEEITDLLKRHGVCLLIDGMDEIPLSIKNLVVSDIAKICVENPETRIVISSRQDDANTPLDFLEKYKILPLTIEESIQMIKLFDGSGENSKLLVAKIEEYTPIREFLGNPLMVSLLFRAFDYRQTIPLKKPTFYRQVYDSLFLDHDIKKGDAFIREKNSKLEIDDFHKVTRALGFVTFMKGEVEYSKDSIISLISEAKKRCPEIDFKPNDLLQDLYSTVPMFVKDGDSFRWSHKSLQEYFAAQFVCNDLGSNTKSFFESLISKEGSAYYRNFTDIIYDANYNIFEEYYLSIMIRRILLDYQIILSNSKKPIVLDDTLISRRIELTLYKKMVISPYDYSKAVNTDGSPENEYLNQFFLDASKKFDPDGETIGTVLYVVDEPITVICLHENKHWFIDFLLSKRNRIIRNHTTDKEAEDRLYVFPPIKSLVVLDLYNKVYFNYSKNYENTNKFLEKSFGYSIDIEVCKNILRELDNRDKLLLEMF